MAVQFILGRSGTGKTDYCIKAVVNELLKGDDKQPLILLVPEQATYQAERSILTDKRITGYNRLNVLSFDRLLFLLAGRHTARPALSRIGRQMIIQRILRENESKLQIFGPSASWAGLGRRMANTLTELHRYAKTPDDIDNLIGQLAGDEQNNLTALKFSDIGLILKNYLEFIEGKFFDPDIRLTQACGAVGKADFVKGAKLWIDGFAGFTTEELAILTELLKTVKDAQVALCLDPTVIDPANPENAKSNTIGIFNPTERTYTTLVDIVKKCKLRIEKPVILDEPARFFSSSYLAHIERNIFELKPKKIPATDNIRIISAPNARAEIRFVVRQILGLVKDRDYRYRDIAVIASDIGRYEHYIRAYFDDYGVPFFIDKQKSLNQHPVIHLIISALRIAAGGFSHYDIFTYLKTDLVPIERSEVDELENYCLAFGVNESDWTGEKEWRFAGDDKYDQKWINKIRLKAVGPLNELRDRLCPHGDRTTKEIPAVEFVRAVFDFLNTLDIPETLGKWIEEAESCNDKQTAEEHRQFYDRLIDIFDEFVEVFAGQRMRCQDYLAILDSAFSQLMLAFIPPTLDQVLVGSIERSRHPDLKAVFLIGATQRQFPVPVNSDSILSDDDRKAADSAGFELAATASQELIERQYLAYIAFTRASEYLCVTYPVTDDKGSGTPRSQFIDNLEALFENLKEQPIGTEQIEVDKVQNKGEIVDLLCQRLGRDAIRDSTNDSQEELRRLLEDMSADEELAASGANVLSAINYDNRAELHKEVVGELFGGTIRSSISRLSAFAACPYKHFARYVLALKQREEFKLEPLDIGNFYHRVLDALQKILVEKNMDFAAVGKKELLELLNEQITNLTQTDAFISNFVRRSAHNRYIIASAVEVLENCVLAITQMVQAGGFRPKFSEISFGDVRDAQQRLGKFEIELGDGRLLSLDGKIDRLDIAEIDGQKIAAVFDYKRRQTTFNWSKFYYGLDMQLPIYMLAVKNADKSEIKNIVGAFYMPVETKIETIELEEIPTKTDKFRHKANGIFNGEYFQHFDNSNSNKFYNFFVDKKGNQYGYDNISGALRPQCFEQVLEFAEKKILELAAQILSCEIEARPYRLGTESPCGYCDYKPLCRFDWQINEYNFLESLWKLQVLDSLGREDG